MDKRVRSTSLYHFRQFDIVIKPSLDCLDYIVVCFMMRDCSGKLQKPIAVQAESMVRFQRIGKSERTDCLVPGEFCKYTQTQHFRYMAAHCVALRQ